MARTVASIVKIAIRMLRRVTGMMKIVTWMVSIIRSSGRMVYRLYLVFIPLL